MRQPKFAVFVALPVFVIPPALAGQPAEAEPEQERPYSFLNPTPREFRRPLTADRPDATESPYSLNAGALQLELSFAEYTFDDNAAGQSDTVDVAPFLLRYGLTENTDLQLTWTPYSTTSGDAGDADGIGDIGLRLKVNIYGNDRGPLAVGVLPFVTFPTGEDEIGSGNVEGGVIIPVSYDLSEVIAEGWGVGGQVQFDFSEDSDGEGTVGGFAHTLVLGIPVSERIGLYAEYIGEIALEQGDDYSPFFSTGATYAIDDDTQLDLGVVSGLDNDDTEDLRIFAGVTLRF